MLERIGALIGDDAQIDWVESTVRYGRKEEGDGLAGMLAIFGQRLLVVVTLQNVREHRWPGARDDDGAVDTRLIRRSDLVGIEVPASSGYDNGPDAWGAESDGTWRYRTSIELVYRDGTRIELGGGQFGDVSTLLPSLRDDRVRTDKVAKNGSVTLASPDNCATSASVEPTPEPTSCS